MTIALIINPNSGTAEQADVLHDALEPMSGIELLYTEHKHHAIELVQQVVRDGAEMVVAVGGDGTINEVVNGLMRADRKVCLGIIPLGTGNDLSRTLALPTDPLEAFALLTTGQIHQLDVIEVHTDKPQTYYAFNVAAGGFSGQVDEVLTDELKEAWGPLAYLRGAAGVLPDLTNYRTTIQYDDGSVENIDALNVIVANGRTAAGGINVAPSANPEDGLLDVVIIKYSSLVDLAATAAVLLVNGNYLNSDNVYHRRAKQVRVRSKPGIWFNVDGELLTNQPIDFRVLPNVLPVIVGPDYQAIPDAARDAANSQEAS